MINSNLSIIEADKSLADIVGQVHQRHGKIHMKVFSRMNTLIKIQQKYVSKSFCKLWKIINVSITQ